MPLKFAARATTAFRVGGCALVNSSGIELAKAKFPGLSVV